MNSLDSFDSPDSVSRDLRDSVAPPVPQSSAGQLLRLAREASGLHVAALAVSLKVPVRKLEALEADQLHLTQDAVFVRALAGSVCRALKTDAGPILARLPQTTTPRLGAVTTPINRAFSSASASPSAGRWNQLSRPMLFGVFALVFAALALMFLPDFLAKMRAAQASGAATQVGLPAQVATSPPAAGGETVLGAPRAAGGESPAAPSTSAAQSPSTAQSPLATQVMSAATLPSAVTTTVQNTAVATASTTVGLLAQGFEFTGSGQDTVLIKAIQETWVDVTDAQGRTKFRKTLTPGEVAGAGGGVMKVTIGRADAAQVLIRGKGFDLALHTRDNVARFEVR